MLFNIVDFPFQAFGFAVYSVFFPYVHFRHAQISGHFPGKPNLPLSLDAFNQLFRKEPFRKKVSQVMLTTSTIETAVLKHSRDSDKALIPTGKSYLSGIGHRFSSYFISQML